jgi:hypothetical protein
VSLLGSVKSGIAISLGSGWSKVQRGHEPLLVVGTLGAGLNVTTHLLDEPRIVACHASSPSGWAGRMRGVAVADDASAQ